MSVLVLVICMFGLVFAYLFFFVGLKERINFGINLFRITDTNERSETTRLFYGANANTFGGVVGRIGDKGMWVWGRYYPVYFSFQSDTSFGFLRGCNRDFYAAGRTRMTIWIEKFPDLEKLKREVRVGMHAYIYSDAGRVIEVIFNPDIKLDGVMPLFCNLRLK